MNWTQIFEGTNCPKIPDMKPIKYTGEREEFDVNITNEEINNMHRKIITERFTL
jgi:hypothetical protein